MSRKVVTELFDNIPIHLYPIPFVEGDTICGLVADKCQEDGYHVKLFTGDKDLLQMVDDDIDVVLIAQGRIRPSDELYNIKNVFNIWSSLKINIDKEEGNLIRPTVVPYLRGIIGDSSDAIAGVKGLSVSFVNQLVNIMLIKEKYEFEDFEDCKDFFYNIYETLDPKKDKSLYNRFTKLFKEDNLNAWKISYEISDIRLSMKLIPPHALISVNDIYDEELIYNKEEF